MVIILEGLDGIGKSTLCTDIKEKLSIDVIHEGYPGETPGIRLWRMKRLIENIKKDDIVIYDRCTCIDDFVYGHLNDKESELEPLKDVVKNILSKTNIIYLSLEDEKEHKRRFEARGDNFIKWEDLKMLELRYYDFLTGCGDIHRVNLSDDPITNLQEIMKIGGKLI